MDPTFTIVDLWGALVLRVGTGGYLQTWFLSAPFVGLLAWAQWRGARQLRAVGADLQWAIRSAADLARVRAAISSHLHFTALRAALWVAGLAALAWCGSVLHLRFTVALSHVVALILLPAVAFAARRRFVDRFRALEVEDPEVRAVYEDWLTQWSGPRIRLRAPERVAGAVSVMPKSPGQLSRPI